MVCLMWVLTLASGQNCAMHATTTLSLVLLGFKLKPFEAVYKLLKQLLLWAVGVVHLNKVTNSVISTLSLRADNKRVFQAVLISSSIRNSSLAWVVRALLYGRPMHSGCLLRSRKDLSGEIKLLQKPESLWLEQLILPSSDTSLCFFATGFGNLIAALFIQAQRSFFCCTCELVVVSRVV